MKKSLAIILAVLCVASVLSIGIGAADATSVNPANILGDADFTVTSVISFDEADITSRWAPGSNGDRCTFELGTGINGNGLKMTPKANTCEGAITFPEMDWSGYDGLLWYMDLSAIEYNPDNTAKGQTGSVPLRIHSNYTTGYSWTRNTVEPVLENFDIATYYFENGEWKKSDNTSQNGERFNVPEKFKGWVYVPFTSFITTKGADGNPVAGIYGDIGVGKITVLSGPYDAAANQANSIIIDEIQLVKLDTTAVDTPAATDTEAPDATDTQAPEATDTQAPEATDTQAPEATDTQAPEATDTQANDTEAPADDSGCGSSITGMSVALLGTVVLGTAVVGKKKKKD